MTTELKNSDSLATWRDKVNELISGSVTGSFDYDADLTSALSFAVREGKLRINSDVITIAPSVVAVSASTVNIVVIYTDTVTNEIRVYEAGSVPPADVIPLFSVSTDATDITNIEDLRTWANRASGASGGDSSGILTFDQDIEFDRTIPAGKNALSISPTIKQGVTVTVDDDSTWVIL